MSFTVSIKRGRVWDDAQRLNLALLDFPFQTTGNDEKTFERGMATTLMATEKNYNCDVITQIDKDTTVQSVYCFGKKHRPDMTFDEDGIAIEMKFVTYDGLKEAIGQGYLYRLRYKFVFLVLIVSEKRKDVYFEIENGQEKDLEDTLSHLADEMNIYTYIAPAFRFKTPGVRKVISFFPDTSKVLQAITAS